MGQKPLPLPDDDGGPPPTPDAERRLIRSMRIVRMVTWFLLFLSTTGGGILFCTTVNRSRSSVVIAEVGAVFSTVFIGLYILARCVDSFLDSAERIRRP